MKKKAIRTPKSGPKMGHYSDLLRKTARHVRKRMRISQSELAKLAGISQGLLSKFESGAQDLSQESQQRVIAALEQAKVYGKADAANDWGFSDPFGLGMRLALPAASPQPVPAPRMSKKMLKDQESLDKASDESVQEAIAKLSTEDVAKIIQENNDLRSSVAEHNQRLANLTAAGYAIFPISIENERDDLRARSEEYEQRVRLLEEKLREAQKDV